jgi:predicted GH43/DUF377 family glycosyl hydrolase
MVSVKKKGVVLESTNLGFENQAVLNPACIREGDTIHMFYRAVRKKDYVSSIGYCKLDGPKKVVERAKKPVIFPEFDYEKHGCEDPRIVLIKGTYYMFYTAFDGKNAMAAYATSKDMEYWEKKGTITPRITYREAGELLHKSKLKDKYFLFETSYEKILGKDVLLWEKDTFLFPKKIKGKFALVHRILPDMQIIYFNNFKDLTTEHWKKYLGQLSKHVILESKYWYESRNIGGGCPPIETDKGWLMIYHAVEDSNDKKVYRAGAALLDKKNPNKLIGRLREPLFSPEKKWELKGDVNDVVFPTGAAAFDDTLYIYYGAADKRIAVASLSIKELLTELLKQ